MRGGGHGNGENRQAWGAPVGEYGTHVCMYDSVVSPAVLVEGGGGENRERLPFYSGSRLRRAVPEAFIESFNRLWRLGRGGKIRFRVCGGIVRSSSCCARF